MEVSAFRKNLAVEIIEKELLVNTFEMFMIKRVPMQKNILGKKKKTNLKCTGEKLRKKT